MSRIGVIYTGQNNCFARFTTKIIVNEVFMDGCIIRILAVPSPRLPGLSGWKIGKGGLFAPELYAKQCVRWSWQYALHSLCPCYIPSRTYNVCRTICTAVYR